MRRFCLFLVVLGTIGWITSGELCAQNNPVYFPYVVNDGNTVTELLFTNTTGRDASLTLTGYTEDGTSVEGAPVSVRAHSQVIVSSFAGLSGWVLGESSTPGVVGNVRVRSVNGAAQEIAEPAQPSRTIILPFVAQTGGASTEISIVNPSLYATRVTLDVRTAAGTTLATVDRQVPPFGSFRGSLPEVFGGDRNYDDASHVIARSVPANIFSQEISIVGFEVVRNFSRADSNLDKILGRTDWAALAAVPATGAGSSLTFPAVVRGMDRFSLIGLVNTGATDQSVTLTYSMANSSTVLNSGPILIRANGSLRQTVVDLFGPAGASGDHGVVRVTGATAVRGFLATGSSSGSSIAAMPAQVSGQNEFLFPAVERSATSGTGIALLNDGTARVDVDLSLISPQGATIGRTRRSLGPTERLAEPVESLFLEGLTLPGGYVFVGSTGPIFGYAESGVVSKTFILLTPQPAPGLLPAAQSLFGIRGRITDYSATGTGAAVSGVTIVLSRTGNEDLTTTTDVNGDYLFGNLLPGDYVVKPQQAGRMFSPFNPSVRLDTGSRRVDFVRGLRPSLSSITVVSNDTSGSQTAGNNPDPYAIEGTGEVSLRITGTNFASGQKLFFKRSDDLLNPNGREVLFSFVDPTTIFVRLSLSNPSDLSQLALRGKYELEVAGQIPFADTRSNALSFYVVPPLPVVTRITPTETYARYEIDSEGLTMRVEGFGFRPGARILFNGATGIGETEIDTTYRSSILLEAFLPAHVLRFGGFYIVRVRNVSLLPEVSGEAVNFQVNNLKPEIVSLDPPGPLAIIGPGPVPVTLDMKINGSNFFPRTVVAVTQKIPDIFPAIVPVGGISQCVPVNGRTVLRVRVYNSVGEPVSGVAVTFTAPTIATTGPSGSFPGGAPSVTATSDAFGFAPPLTDNNSTLFTANPFSGPYVIQISGTVDGFAMLAVINMNNLGQGEGCEAVNTAIEFVSSHQVIVKPVSITSKGTYSVVVANPSPGGGYSNEVEFVVTDGRDANVPVITSLSPQTRSAGAGAFNLTVLGSNFSSDSWVNFGTVRLNPISRDSGRIVVTVPLILVPAPEITPVTIPVTVTNPGSTLNPGESGNTGGTSLRAFFTFTR